MRPFATTTTTFLLAVAVGSTYASDAFPTAASSGSATTTDKMPSCWGQCFGQFNVTGSPEMLCSPKISGFVEQCVRVSCEAAGEPAAATQYSSWLHSFCGGRSPFASGSGYGPPAATETSSSTSSESTSSESTSSASTSSSSTSDAPSSSSAPIEGHPPAPVLTGTGGHYPFPPAGTGSPSRPPLPACWQSCFTEFNITYPEALCFEYPGTEVSQCIQASCQGSSDTNAYYRWVQGFCSPATTGVPVASTSSQAETTSSSMSTSSSIVTTSSSASFSAPTFPGTGQPPVGTGSPPPPAFPPMPQCWQSCFGAFNVSQPEALCYGYPGSAVSSCIKSGCDAESTRAYFLWVQSFCLGSTGSAAPAPSTSSSSSSSESTSTSSISMTSSAPSSVPISGTAPIISGTAPPFPHGTGVPSDPSLPPCWGKCFAIYNISSPEALCSRHPGNMVHSCISASCAANETAQYNYWVQSACHVGTGTGLTPSTSSYAPTSSSLPTESSTIPTSSAVVHPTGGEPSFPSGGIPHPTGGVSYPPCWGQCFAQSHVYSPSALCAPDVGSVVSACIAQSCNANDTARYEGWQHSSCNHTIVPTGSGISHAPSTSSTVPSTSSEVPSNLTSSSVASPIGTGSPLPPTNGTVPPSHPPTNFTMPTCWTPCFEAYHVNNPAMLCSPSKGQTVAGCIANMCDGADTAKYNGWKGAFCNSTLPSGTGISSSSAPISTSSASSSAPEMPPPSISVPLGTGSYPRPTGGAQPPSGNYTMPECWNGCFSQFNVSDPRALCAPSLGPLVNSCISTRCNATESGKYTWWLNDFCRKPVPTGASESFSFSLPAGTGSPSTMPSASASLSASASDSVVPSSAAANATAPIGTGVLPPFPPSGTGSPQHPDMPACWTSCFAQNHVTSPASLCGPPRGPVVGACIAQSCQNGTDATAYNGWLQRYCNSTMPAPTGTRSPSTSSYLPSSSSNPTTSSSPAGPVSSSAPVGTAPVGTGSPFPPPSHPAMPPCWTQCFSQNHVTSPSGLCHPPLGPLVDSCISSACNSTAAAGYQGWVHTYCANGTAPHATGGISSSSIASASSAPAEPTPSSAIVPTSSSASVSVLVGPIGTGSLPSGTGVPQTPGGNFPSCWGACFAQNHVVSKNALCLQPTKDAVAGCIAQSCAANETVQYNSWLNGFCPSSSNAPIGTGSSSSMEAPISTGVSTSSMSISASASVSSTITTSSTAAPVNSSIPISSPTNGTQIPACWTTCFHEHNVQSEDALCDPELTAYVAACIEGSCEAGSSDRYAHWVGEYCDAPSSSSPPSHSEPAVFEPSATASASASVSASTSVSSSSSVVIVDPVPATSSSPATTSTEEPVTTGNPHGPPAGHHHRGRPKGRPGKHRGGRPAKSSHGRPGRPARPPFNRPPPHHPQPHDEQPHPTKQAPTMPPVVLEPTSTSTLAAHEEPAPTTTSASSTFTSTTPIIISTTSSAVAEPIRPTTTAEPSTVNIPTVPTTVAQGAQPTTMTTAVKPTPTKNTSQGGPPAYGPPANSPWGNGPPAGYAPWGNGPPPWAQGMRGPPPPGVFKNIVENMRGWIGGAMG